jgi:predicted HicB family RNase H-like nuclease
LLSGVHFDFTFEANILKTLRDIGDGEKRRVSRKKKEKNKESNKECSGGLHIGVQASSFAYRLRLTPDSTP